MGRKPTKKNAIPRLRARKQKSGTTCYYYDHGGRPRREEPLGRDYGLAIKRWAELEREGSERAQSIITFRYVAERYRIEVIPTKAPRTQRDNLSELTQLLAFFDDPPAPLDAIQPQHVRQYLRWRSKAPIRATREKALLSHLWNWAREMGYTALSNPCSGIKGKRAGRDVYVEDGAFEAVYEKAPQHVRDAMDLLYVTGQRPSDVLRMDETHIRDGILHVQQGKTGTRLRFDLAGELLALIERIKARKRACAVYATRLAVDAVGRPLSLGRLQDHFVAAREAAGVNPGAFQLRDLRSKAATDKTERSDIRQAQKQLGHTSVTTTEGYVRNRIGDKATTTK